MFVGDVFMNNQGEWHELSCGCVLWKGEIYGVYLWMPSAILMTILEDYIVMDLISHLLICGEDRDCTHYCKDFLNEFEVQTVYVTNR